MRPQIRRYHNSRATVWRADCLDVAGCYEDGRFRLLLTSPPYPGRRGFHMDVPAYEDWLQTRLAAWLPAVDPVRGLVVLVYKYGRTDAGWFDLRQFELLRRLERELGLHCLDIYPWDKLNSPPHGNHDRYDRDEWEIVAVLARSPGYYYRPCRGPYAHKTVRKAANGNLRQASVFGNMAGGHCELHPGGARQGNVLRLSSSGDQGRPRIKGGVFPRELAERFVLQHTRSGDWVVDPFCGSGTTLVMALAHGRAAVGVDIDRRAADTAVGWVTEVCRDKVG